MAEPAIFTPTGVIPSCADARWQDGPAPILCLIVGNKATTIVTVTFNMVMMKELADGASNARASTTRLGYAACLPIIF